MRKAVAGIADEMAPLISGSMRRIRPGSMPAGRLDGTRRKSRLGGNATMAVSMAWRTPRPRPQACPSGAGSAAARPAPCRLPEIQIFGGGAHAGRRVDIQDFMVVCPGAASFAQALDWTAEVYRAAGKLMADAGKLKGVADEGGYWPDFATNEEALEMWCRAIERAGYRPGEQVAISLDIAASELGREAATGSALTAASSTAKA